MTPLERLQSLAAVATEEKWMDGDAPDAAEWRTGRDHVPFTRAQLLKRLRDVVKSETAIGVGKIDMNPRHWTARIFPPDKLRADISDRELEAVRLEELRVMLSILLRGGRTLPISISIGVRDGGESVSGHFPDVVLYLAARLLVDSGLTVRECEAPEAGEPGYPNAFERPCAGLFVEQRAGRGRYCSEACRKRAQNPKWKKGAR